MRATATDEKVRVCHLRALGYAKSSSFKQVRGHVAFHLGPSGSLNSDARKMAKSLFGIFNHSPVPPALLPNSTRRAGSIAISSHSENLSAVG